MKAAIIYVIVLFTVRIMGKRQLGEMQPFELVIMLLIAEVACIPLNDPAIPLYAGVVPVVTLTLLQVLMSFIARKSIWARRVFSGSAVIAIDKNGINYQNLKRINVNVDDLVEAARSGGYTDLNDIAYAIFETNGKLCVVEKPRSGPPPETATLPLSLVTDGYVYQKNLALAGLKEADILAFIRQNKLKSLKEVLYMDIRQDGTVYLSPKNSPCLTGTIPLTGGQSW
jgi:uncharacterized membrane protein YcaP (DUF421 family)